MLPPYADFLGLRLECGEDGALLVMPPGAHLIGRPGFLHGGALAGLLEIAAMVAVREALGMERVLKPITVTIDYMRGARMVETFARGTVARLGARIANVEATAWQHDRAKPVAAARMNLLLG